MNATPGSRKMSTYSLTNAHRVRSESFLSPRFTLWMGDAGENLIRAIAIQTIGIEVILDITIPEIDLLNLTVQVTPETVRIRGTWKIAAQIEGCFCPAPYEVLIPLPYAVFPEATTAKQHDCGLVIHLARQLEDEPVSVQLNLMNKQWAIPEIYS